MNSTLTESSRIAAFTRGWFCWLEKHHMQAAILHQWEDAFESEISDVDYVIDPDAFPQIALLVHQYCEEVGWHLCQVLRHEDTAAFCVCSAKDDPSCVVALDACSDYRRKERVLLTAVELLKERLILPWGGFRLNPSVELRYRFLKGAIKFKDSRDFIEIFSRFPNEARTDVEKWLISTWGVTMEDWNDDSIAQAWKKLEMLTLEKPVKSFHRGLQRIAKRILMPTGLVVGVANDKQKRAILSSFGRLYFRRHAHMSCFHPFIWKQIVLSTLVICQQPNPIWKYFFGKNLWISAETNESPDEFVKRIASFLENRCAMRERLNDGEL